MHGYYPAKILKAYICNADNLGGFKQGSGGTDDIIQTIVSPNPVFGGPGSYPLEGGYLYFTPIGSPTLGECHVSYLPLKPHEDFFFLT